MDYSVEQRRDHILELLKEQGTVRVSSLSKRFNISEVVIRKDLQCLETLGVLERRHGGAVRIQRGYLYKDLEERMATMGPQKHAIAHAARLLMSDARVIMLNSGSTNVYLARELALIEGLVVITNAVRAASELADSERNQVILLGGEIKARYQFTYGQDALRILKKYHADICFISLDGVDASQGLTSYYHYEADTIRQMLAHATRRVIIADSTKIGKISLEHVGDITEIDIIITDDNAPEDQIQRMRALGVQVTLVNA